MKDPGGSLKSHATPERPGAVPLTETERQIMRVVDLYPGAASSEIARHTRLQRTNVSTALRALEQKGLISRAASTGRGIAVTPTERALVLRPHRGASDAGLWREVVQAFCFGGGEQRGLGEHRLAEDPGRANRELGQDGFLPRGRQQYSHRG